MGAIIDETGFEAVETYSRTPCALTVDWIASLANPLMMLATYPAMARSSVTYSNAAHL